LVYPEYDRFFCLSDYAGNLIKEIIGNHDTTKAITKHSWINFLVGYAIIPMYYDSSFVGIGIAIVKSIKPERFPVFTLIEFSYFIFSK
jgi:hypothetical protein